MWTMSQQGDPKPFRPPLVKKTNSCRIGREWVIYALHVHDRMGMVFYKKFKNDRNNAKPLRGIILCDIVISKNIKLDILIMSQKNLHKMTYLVRGFLAFGSNDQCYG